MNQQWIENGPNAPIINVNDYVLYTNYKTRYSGYVAAKGPGWLNIKYGPTIPDSAVIKFLPRNGEAIPVGNQALILTHL